MNKYNFFDDRMSNTEANALWGILLTLVFFSILLSCLAALPAIYTKTGYVRAMLSTFFANTGISVFFAFMPGFSEVSLFMPLPVSCVMCAVFFAQPWLK